MTTNLLSISRVRDAVTKTAKLLAQDKVEIRQRGGKPFVAYKPNGEVDYVNLPVIPDKPSEEFLKCLHGFMDHEVAHVLFTNNLETRAVVEEARRGGYKEEMVKSFANCFEDVRIERAMSARYKGAAYNFTNSLKYVLNESIVPALNEVRKQPPSEARDTGMMHASFLAYARMKGGDDDARAFMDEHELHPFFDTIEKVFPDMSARLAAMKTSGDAARVALDFVKAITPPPPEPEEEPEDGEGDDGEGTPPPEKPEDDKSEGDGDGGGKPEDKDEKKDEEKKPKKSSAGGDKGDDLDAEDGEGEPGEEDAPGAGEPGDGDGEGDGDAEGESETEDSDGDAEGGDGEASSGDGSPSDGGKPVDGRGVDPTPVFEKFLEDGAPSDMDEAMGELISDLVGGEYKGAKYADYTFDDDEIKTAPILPTANIERIESKVQQISATMQKDLQRLIMARSQSIMVPGFRSGRINPSALHRLKTGDDRVFRRKHEADNLDVAITLLIDLSGSMNGAGKIHLALESAWAFSQVLDKLNVSHEVLGFTTTQDSYGSGTKASERKRGAVEFAKQVGMDPGSVRWEALSIPIFKEFSERFSLDVKRRIASASLGSVRLLQNIDGASVKIAAMRLLQRTEKRKVLMVFSDGEPSSMMSHTALNTHLIETVKTIEANGIETIGVGIMTDSVKRFYPKNFVVHNIGELPAKVMGELRTILLK